MTEFAAPTMKEMKVFMLILGEAFVDLAYEWLKNYKHECGDKWMQEWPLIAECSPRTMPSSLRNLREHLPEQFQFLLKDAFKRLEN